MFFSSSAESYVPFKDFFALISFISSLTTSISISATFGLSSTKAFLGRTDDETLAQVYRSANIFAWAAAINGAALLLSLLFQLLYTSPTFTAILLSGPEKSKIKTAVGVGAWISLGLVGGATALIGEGLKVVDVRVGTMLEWILLAFGLPIWVFWVAIRPPHAGNASGETKENSVSISREV